MFQGSSLLSLPDQKPNATILPPAAGNLGNVDLRVPVLMKIQPSLTHSEQPRGGVKPLFAVS